MDEAAIEEAGLAPLRPGFDRIAAITNRTALARYVGSPLRADVDLFNATDDYTENLLGVWIAQDLDDPAHYIPYLVQGGLGMPDRDYYYRTDPKSQDLRQAYLKYIREILTLLGTPAEQAATDADRILALETALAESSLTRVQQRDPKAVFHPMTVGELAVLHT